MFFSVDTKTVQEKNWIRILTEGATACFLSSGILFTAMQILKIGCPLIVPLLGTILSILIFELLSMKKWELRGTFLFSAAAFGITVSGFSPLIDGLIILNNTMAQIIGERTGIILHKYVIKDELAAGRNMEIAVFFLALVCGLIIFWIMRGRQFWLVLILTFLVFFLAGHLESVRTSIGLLLTVLGMTGVVVLSVYSGKCPVKNHAARLSVELYLELVALVLLGAFLVMSLFPAMPQNITAISKSIQTEAKEVVNQLRYEKKHINSLPKGQINKAGKWFASEDTALTVTADHLESCYLRGFVGSSFDGNKWKKLETADYYDNSGLFYWLHKDGFYGNAQLDTVRGLIQDDHIPDQDQSMQITNQNADSEYLYMPYEMKANSWNDSHICDNSDETLQSTGLFGSRSYECHTNGTLTQYFPELAAETYLYFQEKKDSEYEKAESYYNDFVYKHYTTLSKSQRELIKNELGKAGDQSEEHIDYYFAITKIRDLLKENFKYDKDISKIPKGRNFLNYFLTQSRTGYDVQFSSVAVLMFRYYGIPARYVEGYVITEKDISGNKKKVDISAANGHAWPEIYVDGIGWVPIEVSPDYQESMKQPDLTKGLHAVARMSSAAPKENKTDDAQDEKSLPELLQETMIDLFKVVLLILLIFDVGMLIFMLFTELRRFFERYRRQKAFSQKDNRKAVLFMMQYAMALILYGHSELYGRRKKKIREYLEKDFSNELLLLYDTAMEVGEKAAFSESEISESERKKVMEYVRKLREEKTKTSGWYNRWMMRYIERL